MADRSDTRGGGPVPPLPGLPRRGAVSGRSTDRVQRNPDVAPQGGDRVAGERRGTDPLVSGARPSSDTLGSGATIRSPPGRTRRGGRCVASPIRGSVGGRLPRCHHQASGAHLSFLSWGGASPGMGNISGRAGQRRTGIGEEFAGFRPFSGRGGVPTSTLSSSVQGDTTPAPAGAWGTPSGP